MKIDRRLRQYKNIIEKLCGKFCIKRPLRVEIMGNWINRPEINFSKITLSPTTQDYTLKIRRQKIVDGKLINIEPEKITHIICETLAGLNQQESHQSLANEMLNYIRTGE